MQPRTILTHSQVWNYFYTTRFIQQHSPNTTEPFPNLDGSTKTTIANDPNNVIRVGGSRCSISITSSIQSTSPWVCMCYRSHDHACQIMRGGSFSQANDLYHGLRVHYGSPHLKLVELQLLEDTNSDKRCHDICMVETTTYSRYHL